MNFLTRLLQSRPWLLADGATGTNYFEMGLGPGDAPELWNLEFPERVQALHRRFIEAGSDIILTNTFGGTSHRLKLHNADSRVYEINRAAAGIARRAVEDSGGDIVVAGSMGPTGEILAPIGTLSHPGAVEAFKEQARGLKDGGVDVLWLETLSSTEELEAAAEAAKLVGLEYICTLSFDTNGNTMMGVTPASLTTTCESIDPAPLAYGTNCGVGASEVVVSILGMHRSLQDGKGNLVAKANCGIPEYEDGRIVYNGTPELMASYACMARSAGARIIGGCCGTTPEHISAMRQALEQTEISDPPSIEQIVSELGEITDGARRCCTGIETPVKARRKNRRRNTRNVA